MLIPRRAAGSLTPASAAPAGFTSRIVPRRSIRNVASAATSNSWRNRASDRRTSCSDRFLSVMSRAIVEPPIRRPAPSRSGDTPTETTILRPSFRSRTVSQHPPLLLIDPHLELEGRTPDDFGAFEPEQPEELQVRFDEAPVVEGADRHRNGTRMEGLLERLDRGAPRGLDLVPFEDLADSAPDVRQEVQEGLVRLADRLAEQDRDRFDAGPSADREPDRAAKTEPLRILRPTEF